MSVNLGNAERGGVIGEPSDVKALKSEESIKPGKARRKSSKKTNHRRSKHRLGGGTDDPSEDSPKDSQSVDPDPDDEIDDAGDEHEQAEDARAHPLSTTHSKLSVSKPSLPSTGDPRVDELLACALQNPDEASKALRGLGENLEHELKLFLIDLMGRIRKWVDAVESKIEWTRRDLLKLHKELTLRISQCVESRRESDALKDKLATSEATKNEAQKPLTDNNVQVQKDPNPLKRSLSAARSIQTCGDDAPLSRCASRMLQDRTGHYDVNEMREEAERLQSCCAEMEQELLEMKKEKERMVKERAEYENAIQRALLKGVSSLNVEALKVLKCTPIPECCSPCPPSSSIEPARGERGGQGCSSGGNNGRYNGSNNNNNNNGNNNSSCRPGNRSSRETLSAKRASCPGSGGASKSKKSRDNNMLLLLHQRDAENFGIQTNCDSGKKKKQGCYSDDNRGKSTGCGKGCC